MSELKGLTALIIEPNQGMRVSLRHMLNQFGMARIDDAGSAGQAIRQLSVTPFDLVLCEYDLDGGQDGQQMLEDLRHHKLINAATMFFMVTSEGSFSKVVSAVELAPAAYILKPFTAERLLERLGRALQKRNVFLPVYQLIELGSEREAIEACIAGAEQQPRYASDFMRVRAELHLLLGEAEVAEPLYAELYDSKGLPWARLGQAKTLFLRGRYEEAKLMLEALLLENKRFLDAYDWLSRTLEALSRLPEAQAVLAAAATISPHAVRRLRRLGEVALAAGDAETAEKAQKLVVAKAKYSEFRDPEDYTRLVQAMLRRGDTQQASATIRELEKSMGGQPNSEVCSAIASAMLHEVAGEPVRLAQALDHALAACAGSVGLSDAMKLELARNCLQHGKEAGAAAVMREVMANAPNSEAMARAMAVFERAGRGELAVALAQQSRQEVVELVGGGAAKARGGDYAGAVELMMKAVGKLPDNPQVVFNAAVAVLKCLENIGWDEALGRQALELIGTVRRLDPSSGRLPALAGLHQEILRKYNIRAGHWKAA